MATQKRTNAGKDETLHLRLPDAVKQRYADHCASMGVSLSEWVLLACAEAWGRQQYYRAVRQMQADLAKAEPVAITMRRFAEQIGAIG